MKLQSLDKDYKRFTNIVVFGAIAISLLVLYFSYQNFYEKSKSVVMQTAIKANQQLDESLTYIENISSFIGKQIIDQENPQIQNIASILSNTKPEIDPETQNIFTWTLFDFIDTNNYVLASSSQGELPNPVYIKPDQRSWITESRITPWKLLSSKKDTGLLSKKTMIPFGFGITKKTGEFFGILSFGINVQKLQEQLESSSNTPYLTFAFLDRDNSIASTSKDFNKEEISALSQKIKETKQNQGFITLNGQEYYYCPSHKSQLKVIVGINKKEFFNQLKIDFLPKALNTFYLTLFFLVLLYFFRAKLLNPVFQLSKAANKLSQGQLHVRIPQSEIAEVNSLSIAINKVKNFLIAEEAVKLSLKNSKDSAECANYNKTEFLASTAHELKNMLAGIIGLGELIKLNLTSPSENGLKMKEKETENISWIVDIIKLGEESATFVNDILDINQAQTGDFKIDREESIDLLDATLRSIKLMKTRALKEKKIITTNFDDKISFQAHNLDPRRVKQIIVNIISNSIKYSPEGSKIKVSLRYLTEEESNEINDIIEQNIQNNYNFTDDKVDTLLSLLQSKRDNKEARISIEIEDTGFGMSTEELDIATKKYGIVKHDITKKIDSTGLGLPIVRHLIEAQCGLFKIRSEKGKGTTVTIIF